MNNTEIITAFIALGGIIFSIIISYIVSSQNAKLELHKHKEQIAQNFGQRLFEKRIDSYPKLYSIVCRYARDLKSNTMDINKLKDYYKEIYEWDINNSIYMSEKTHSLFWLFRIELLDLSGLTESEYREKYVTDKSREKLREKSKNVELALKNELGVFAYESPYRITPGFEIKKFKKINSQDNSIEIME